MFRTATLALTTSVALTGAAFAESHSSGAGMDGEMEPKMNIVETAQATDGFSTLVTAVTEAGLAETLSSEGPYTVFAPNDAAFEALPEGALDELLANPDALSGVLTYHVVQGSSMAADIEDDTTATTVNGEEITFSVDGDTVMVNGATVIMADVSASNGVIHVIDTVLMPGE